MNIAGFQPPQVDPEDTFRENAKGPMLIICGTEDEVCTRPPLSMDYATWMKFHHCRCIFTNVVITFSNISYQTYIDISYHISKSENTLWQEYTVLELALKLKLWNVQVQETVQRLRPNAESFYPNGVTHFNLLNPQVVESWGSLFPGTISWTCSNVV